MKHAHEEPTAPEQVARARRAWEEREHAREGGQLQIPLEQGEKENLQLTLDKPEGSC